MTTAEKLNKLEKITQEQQEIGKNKLQQQGRFLPIGNTIEDVMDNIPTDDDYYTKAEVNYLLNQLMGDLSSIITDISDIKALIPSTATSSNKFATSADVSGTAITSASSISPITDSADARVQGIRIFGRTENGASVGDNGLVINSHGKNFFNINGEVNYNAVNASTPPENWAIDTSSLKSTVSGTTITARKNANYYFLDGQKINVIAGETYTLSFRMLESEVGGVARVSYWDETEQKNKHAVNWWHSNIFTTQHITFTAPANLILLCFGTGASTPVSFTDIQLEKGSAFTDWEAYRGSALTITTGLPLRSSSESVYDELDCAAGTVTTRCEVVEGEVVPLATPTVTPLSSTELAAWRMLRTYGNLNYIEVTDNPQITVSYLKNTDNGSAISEIVDDLQGQIGYDLAKRIEDIEDWIAEQEQGV